MTRIAVFGVLLLLTQGFSTQLRAQQNMIPAGTLLRCILDEPRLSPANTETGDPIICRLSYNRIGGVTLPPGSYLGGHVEAEKRLGNFSTHGYIKLVFDRLGTSNRTLPMPSKVIAIQNHSVNREGQIIGGWLSDPVLKPETAITLRLMEDVSFRAPGSVLVKAGTSLVRSGHDKHVRCVGNKFLPLKVARSSL